MSAIHDYPKEFIERTLSLLENVYPEAKNKKLEVTFLLNCLLGLIIATYEQFDRCKGDFFKKRLLEEDVIEYVPETLARIDLNEFHKRYRSEINKKSLIGQLAANIKIENQIEIQKFKLAKNITLKEFIKNIRNGVAHQNLMAISKDNHWHGIRIWNHDRNGIKDFEVEFEISQLMKFAKFVGEKYLENLPEKMPLTKATHQ